MTTLFKQKWKRAMMTNFDVEKTINYKSGENIEKL